GRDRAALERHLPESTRRLRRPDMRITELLRRAKEGDQVAAEEVIPLVYDVLRDLAQRERRARNATLVTTEILNAAYLRLFRPGECTWKDKDHFTAVASLAIRHVLVDHARRKKREKRAIKGERVPLDSILEAYEREAGDIEALNEALCRLQAQDEELAEIVQLRFFGRVDW